MHLTEVELRRWGRAIGEGIDVPVFIGLRGELGAGKSVLARAVARGAGVTGTLPSPTFNLLFRYRGTRGGRPIRVAHMDLYRISSPEEIWELGWEERIAEDEIVLVEWPGRAGAHLPEDRWDILLHAVPGDPVLREVEVDRVGTPPDLPPFPLTLDVGREGG